MSSTVDGLAPPNSGSMRLFDHIRPALEGGEYELTVSQELKRAGTALGPAMSHTRRFRVAAPRLALRPDDIHAVYPPADSEGDYADGLPHIVLRRRSLPWDLSSGSPTAPGPPWLALLVFHADQVPVLRTGAAGDLLGNSDDSGPRRPDIELRGQESDQVIAVIDVPDFQRLRPYADDLPWLAHVRQVSTEDKELLGQDNDGWFSVVIANRLPAEGGRNVAHLVSLEGVDLNRSSVRLVSLARWSFTAEVAKGSFAQKIQRITTGSLQPRTEAAAEDNDVDRAVAAGFVPMRYDLRHGEQTVAWYRGPLVPEPVDRTTRAPFPSAEAAMVYHPGLAMFDLSLAVAWQLGRLLGLSDATFSTSLMRWRQETQRRIDGALAREAALERHRQIEVFGSLRTLAEQATLIGDTPPPQTQDERQDLDEKQEALRQELKTFIQQLWNPNAISAAVGRFAARDVLGAVSSKFPLPRDDKRRLVSAPQQPASPPNATTNPVESRPSHTTDVSQTDDERVEEAEDQAEVLGLADLATTGVPIDVESWLARLALLYGVPFEHLVPHPSMLPPESIRFFHIDTNWLEAAIDGAFSVGVHSARDIRFHRQLQDAVRVATDTAAGKLRSDLRDSVPAVATTSTSGARAGFLLRSEIVAGWPGLEVRASVANQAGDRDAISLLRLDRLAPDLMLGIFAAVPDMVEIDEPAEDLHFAPRRADPDASHRRNPANPRDRRVDIHALGTELADGDSGYRSADLADALIETAARQRFTVS